MLGAENRIGISAQVFSITVRAGISTCKKGLAPKTYKLDFLVQDRIMVELKSLEDLAAIHESQLLTHIRLCHKQVSLLINFNVKLLKDGIMRRVI